MKKFDLEQIITTYAPPQGQARDKVLQLLTAEGFRADVNTTALIGIGGTISSAYSPTKETLVPMASKPALQVTTLIKEWEINKDVYTAFDPFAKDSRDIETQDVQHLLDIVSCIPNRKVLVTSGTYLLPVIAESLFRTIKGNKIVTVTGSTLPLGFLFSDAPMNVMSAITLMNYISASSGASEGKVLATYHGESFDTLEKIRAMDLHPKRSADKAVTYPLLQMPIT